jgi:hypothetical protein
MKKFTLIFSFVAVAFSAWSQATMVASAPQNLTTTQVRAPNGLSSQAYLRASSLVLASELTPIPASTTLSAFGFTTTAGANTAVTGSITVYMMNSTDVNFNLGTTWSTIISGMTTVYTGTIGLPTSATTIDLPLTTPFVYTGGAIYVAYDFVSVGPFATTPVTYGANAALTSGCVSGASASSAPTTLGSTNFRPSFRFGFANSLTNDASVEFVNTLGNVPQIIAPNMYLQAIVRNNSAGPLTNVPVTANITGANPFTDNQMISSIAAGATATVNFTNWSTANLGANTVNVSVPADQNNANNSMTFNSMVNCNTGGAAQNPATYPLAIGFGTVSGILSTSVQITNSCSVTGANIAISTNTASTGNNVYGVIMDNSGNILATSINTLNISSGDLGAIRTFSFVPAITFTPGAMWNIGMAQTPNSVVGYYPFGSYTSPYLNAAYFTNAITGGALSLLTTNLGVFGIEANFGGICGPLGIKNVAVSSDNNVTVYPNPASTALNVKLGSVTTKASVEIYNAIGQMVIPSQEISDNSAEINVSSLSKGVYIVRVSNGKEVSNTKLVIER